VPIPTVLTPDLQKVFVDKKGQPDENLTNKMTRAIVSKLVESGHRASKNFFEKAAKKASRKFSPLKVKGDDSCVSVMWQSPLLELRDEDTVRANIMR